MNNLNPPNPFKLLGLPIHFQVDLKVLKQQYHQLQMLHHPDRPGGSQTLSIQINWAYDQVRFPSTRLEWVLKHQELWPPKPSASCLENIFEWHKEGLSPGEYVAAKQEVLEALSKAFTPNHVDNLLKPVHLMDLYTRLKTLERLKPDLEDEHNLNRETASSAP